mgnify:CR=1 FL=1
MMRCIRKLAPFPHEEGGVYRTPSVVCIARARRSRAVRLRLALRLDGGLELALDRGPLALVEVEARGDGQAPRRDLRAAVLVALHDRRRQEQLREARPADGLARAPRARVCGRGAGGGVRTQ